MRGDRDALQLEMNSGIAAVARPFIQPIKFRQPSMSDPNEHNLQSAALAAIVESAVDAIITIDEMGRIVGANPATKSLFGYAVADLIGQNVKTLMPSPYHEEHDGYLENYKASGVRKIVGSGREVVGKREDGSTFPMHLSVSEIEIDGRTLFAGIVRDISDVTEREARLEAILNNAVDAIITIDEKGCIDTVNPATEKVFGYSANELNGKNVKLLMPAPYREEHDGYLKNYRECGVRKIIGIGREVVGQRKDGTTFPMHLAVSEIIVGNRRIFTGIVRDISDLKAAERELAEMNEKLEDRVKERTEQLRDTQAELVRHEKFATLGKVSGGIAHEIRNPLNAVKTSAYYLLNAKNASAEKVREHLQRIDRQVSMIDNVVTALSDVAKLPEANLDAVDLRPIIKNILSAVDIPTSVTSAIEFPNDLPKVLVDESQIVIAFKNLVRNARDAMPNGGQLSITADVGPSSVTFHVTDTGTGISPEHLLQVLEPFFTTKARGMGLGLSITRTIVEKNKGKLLVESELGVGSQFTIELTRSLDDAPSASPKVLPPPIPTGLGRS